MEAQEAPQPRKKTMSKSAIAATSALVSAATITQQADDKLENAHFFQRTLARLKSIIDKKHRNETKFIRDRLSFAA